MPDALGNVNLMNRLRITDICARLMILLLHTALEREETGRLSVR